MSDTSEPNSDEEKGFRLDKEGVHCIPRRCNRQFYHKESKTMKEEGKASSNTVEDRRNFNLVVTEDIKAQTKYSNQQIHYRQEVLRIARLDGQRVENPRPKKIKK